jgi:hypothetical protein
MRKRYFIEVGEKLNSTVYCPTELLENNQITTIAFGSCSIEATFLPLKERKNKIIISKNIVDSIHFCDFNMPLHIFTENQTLFIGPLVGIFTAGFTPFPLRPMGERSLFFSKLLSVKKSVGALPFIFGEQHIDWEQGLIRGYFFHQNGWEIREVPFPNVIYDRLPNRKTENRSILKRTKERLQREYLIPWYNPGFFNKLDVYDRLIDDPSVAKFLPETSPFTSFSYIEDQLAKYGHVFIKPFNGSLGYGVHQIIYDKQDNHYYCRYCNKEGENRLQKFSTLEGLFSHVFNQQNMSKMIIQQGIQLLRINQRTVDFRVHTNKDEDGKWQVTAIAAKVAGAGSPTTHMKNGGVIKTLEEIFNEDESSLYNEKLTEVSLKLSESIENHMEGIIGEIGFDLGIDRNGDVWLFEANSKPGRSIFTHPQLKEFDLLTRKLSIAFAVFLTEQSIVNPERIFK